ncbi:unnamed protein product [Sphagnum tenellum]
MASRTLGWFFFSSLSLSFSLSLPFFLFFSFHCFAIACFPQMFGAEIRFFPRTSAGFSLSRIFEFQSRSAEATEEASEEFEAALKNTLKSVQEAWDKADDKLAISGLGFAALLVLWASTGLINAIDKLPLIPAVFEFVGILFSGWFVYRYLLFKPDREELFKLIDDAKSKITGQ